MITSLKPNQVFIFGSNSSGFHGAGAAGLACRGTASNTWRTDPWFLKAMKSPVGSPDRIGKWAIYGIDQGFMEGKEGKSYAICTIKEAGRKRSWAIEDIEIQLIKMVVFVRKHPEYEFLMTPIGTGLAGWTDQEMGECLDMALGGNPPSNLVIPDGLYGRSWK